MIQLLPWKRDRGQSIVELALVIPLWTIFAFACFQFAILFLTHISVLKSARDGARWVAVHPHTLDSDATAALRGRLPPNIVGSGLSITILPTCTALTAGQCPNRAPGQQIAMTVSYDVRSLIFVPTTLGFRDLVVRIPTTMPAYTLFMAAEPTDGT